MTATDFATYEDLQRQTEAETFQHWFVHESEQKAKRAWTVAIISMVSTVLMAAGCLIMVARWEPIIWPIIQHPDGTMEVAWSWGDWMRDHPDATLKAWLLSWLEARVGYNYYDAPANYKKIEHSSCGPVFLEYDKWMSLQNPDSPQHTIGEFGGKITVEPDSITFEDKRGGETRDGTPKGFNTAYFRYWRITTARNGDVKERVLRRATLAYRENQPVPDISRWFNPEGWVVCSFADKELTPQ